MSPAYDAGPAAAGCVEPELGARARQALGRALSPALRAHLDACLACAVERASFNAMYAAKDVPPPRPGLAEQIVAAALRARRPPSES
jgi:hypothetical protein